MVLTLLIFATSVLLVYGTPAQSTKPHIVFTLVDDWGYADVSFRNPAIYSPNFKNLADIGVMLNRHYVFKYCSPSRASFLTGRWPHHVHQHNMHPSIISGTNINMTMLPAKLKEAGYKTHLIGKWHQGFYESKYLPLNRGFDTFTGFFNGAKDHITGMRQCAIDSWKNNDIDTRNGIYTSYKYIDDLKDIFNNHDECQPLFLYLSLHNVHGPLQAPEEWLNIYPKGSTCEERRIYQAMISVADNVTGTVVELMKQKGMWDNTIFIVSSDNGAAYDMGSNYPLKGGKMSFFEGGVRSLAFATGGLIPESMRGKSTDGFIHIADWYTTFCNLAGVDPSDSGDGKFPVDGLNVWPIIMGEQDTTSHDVIALGYDYDRNGAIISGNYKLVVGEMHRDKHHLMWTPLDYPCTDGPMDDPCDPYCLYDIVNDPEEKNELSKRKPDILNMMLEKYNSYAKEPSDLVGYRHPRDVPQYNRNELNGVCLYMETRGGYWRPWNDD